VDVANLEIGDVLHVRDLPVPEGVTLLSDPDLGVAHVALPAAEAEAPAAEEAIAAVPAEGAAPAAVEGAEKTE
jgi:large subunit ribosomal protein L25